MKDECVWLSRTAVWIQPFNIDNLTHYTETKKKYLSAISLQLFSSEIFKTWSFLFSQQPWLTDYVFLLFCSNILYTTTPRYFGICMVTIATATNIPTTVVTRLHIEPVNTYTSNKGKTAAYTKWTHHTIENNISFWVTSLGSGLLATEVSILYANRSSALFFFFSNPAYSPIPIFFLPLPLLLSPYWTQVICVPFPHASSQRNNNWRVIVHN